MAFTPAFLCATAWRPALGYAPTGGEWAGDGVGLGFRQTPGAVGVGLHFDVEAGLALAAHVRLDDRDGLGAALGLSGPECASLADGELVLRSCRKWGRDAPGRLVGDYAFALWDARRRSLLCARDHVGARPFYYALTAKAFVFAGSLDAVLAAPGVSEELDEAMAAAWLTRAGLHENSRTLFKDAHKLPPGHSLICRRGVRRPPGRIASTCRGCSNAWTPPGSGRGRCSSRCARPCSSWTFSWAKCVPTPRRVPPRQARLGGP